jgi:hypothetical protein
MNSQNQLNDFFLLKNQYFELAKNGFIIIIIIIIMFKEPKFKSCKLARRKK